MASIYKLHWQIEVFFRWIKRHLNVPTLFGTTPNAVFSQPYFVLLVSVLLKSAYDEIHSAVPPSATCHLPLLLACSVFNSYRQSG
ncbi:transposase [Paenibacillus sp. BR2-3]|uniref:transposase n=1 Tax=Paenibacillus sp. BR2-3 TaxID=3048494 RepID=UPI0039772F35